MKVLLLLCTIFLYLKQIDSVNPYPSLESEVALKITKSEETENPVKVESNTTSSSTPPRKPTTQKPAITTTTAKATVKSTATTKKFISSTTKAKPTKGTTKSTSTTKKSIATTKKPINAITKPNLTTSKTSSTKSVPRASKSAEVYIAAYRKVQPTATTEELMDEPTPKYSASSYLPKLITTIRTIMKSKLLKSLLMKTHTENKDC